MAVYKDRILIVDDDQTCLALLTNMLSKQGYEAHPVSSGSLALKVVQDSPPDLILLNTTMPGMNGYEVCQQLKMDEQTRDIPIIFISAWDGIADKVQAFEVGGVDYITKPFRLKEVLARVQVHLALRQKQLQQPQTAVEPDRDQDTLNAEPLPSTDDWYEPLAYIVGMAETLRSKYGDELDQHGLALIQGISDNGRRMIKMVETWIS